LKKKDHLEGWLLSHVWLFIDKAFENIEGVEAIRGESCSIASSSRKNRDRNVPSVSSMPRKIMSRRGYLIIRSMYKEYGCGEAGKLYTGYNGTKVLRERGLKTPKMMKDQFDDLCKYIGSKEKKSEGLRPSDLFMQQRSSSSHYTVLAWKAKKIVINVIEMMNENDEENQLQALQQSCENTLFLSPSRDVICRTASFDTPRSKDKK
ncbi:1470_t:CDS:2, partial [Scutellospora calospora]